MAGGACMGCISSVRFFSMIKEIPVKSGRLYAFFFFYMFSFFIKTRLVFHFVLRLSPLEKKL